MAKRNGTPKTKTAAPQLYRVPVRVVFYREDGAWVAHCLEFDLVGAGKSKEAALRLLAEAIAIQVEASARFKNWANLFAPAEGKYFAMFAAGRDVPRATLQLARTDLQSASSIIKSVQARVFEARSALPVVEVLQ